MLFYSCCRNDLGVEEGNEQVALGDRPRNAFLQFDGCRTYDAGEKGVWHAAAVL